LDDIGGKGKEDFLKSAKGRERKALRGRD